MRRYATVGIAALTLGGACTAPSAVVGSPAPVGKGQATTAGASAPSGTVYALDPSPSTVAWGYYGADAKPVLTVKSGDVVDVGTVSTCNPRAMLRAGLDSSQLEKPVLDIYHARDSLHTLTSGPGGHILTGPIYIEGADSGDVLEVRLQSITLAKPWACNGFGGKSGFLPEDFGYSRMRVIPLDTVHMLARFADNIAIPLHPFFGSIGDAPPASMGRVNSAPPGIHAGNMDNKELVAGTTLYIPVWTKGALLEIGDGHAGQGNGEVDITALETALRGRLQLIVRKDLHLGWPMAETPTHWIAVGMDKDLTQATKIAVRNAIAFLMKEKGLSHDDAYMLTSVAADVDITELVDGNVGVHVMIPKAVFR